MCIYVHMFKYGCVYVYIYMYMCVWLYVYIWKCFSFYVYMFICPNVFVCLCLYVYICLYMSLCLCENIYIYVQAYMFQVLGPPHVYRIQILILHVHIAHMNAIFHPAHYNGFSVPGSMNMTLSRTSPTPSENKGLIAGLIKGNQWLTSP